MENKTVRFIERTESSIIVNTIRSGLVMMIPVLLIGSFALVLRSLPIDAYQHFISTFLGGALFDIFNYIYNGTFGLLSVYMTICVSLYYGRTAKNKKSHVIGCVMTSLVCFFILVGIFNEGFKLSYLGATGMFTALFSALAASALYEKLWKLANSRESFFNLYSDGADVEFKNAISVIIPGTVTITCCAIFNLIIVKLLHFNGFQFLFIDSANKLFNNFGNTLLSGFLFVLISGVLWFFGIHGGDVLEGVSQNIFVPPMDANVAAVAAGDAPTELFTRTFFDVFVLMGGCGAAISLLIAIMIFSKRKSNKSLAKMAVGPMIFNINEIMIFGLPIIFNPVMFVPFILTPLIAFFTSYAAMATGIVPLTSTAVEWTTPVLMGGYMATGSVAGALLQAFNLTIGVFVYRPFVKMYDKAKIRQAMLKYDSLIDFLKDCENNNTDVNLLSLTNENGAIARVIAGEFEKAMEKKAFEVYYQPQYDNKGRCIGAEALLRWNNELFGMIYPPLVIKLAEETEHLFELESFIFETVALDYDRLNVGREKHLKISVNSTVVTFADPRFKELLEKIVSEHEIKPRTLCIEITEQMALMSAGEIEKIIEDVRESGFMLAIDDFSMGHTSVKYLQDNTFDIVKLDGELIRDIENPRCRDIVSSIVYLSGSLGFKVLAEFVETEEQQKLLEGIGCFLYQGYLYSPAIPFKEFAKLVE